MGLLRTITLSVAQAVNLEFLAQGVAIANATGFWVFISIGGNIPPTANANDLACPPYTYISSPVPANSKFALALSVSPQGFSASQAIYPSVTFYETPIQNQVANVQNPNVVAQAVLKPFLQTNISPNVYTPIISPVAGVTLQVFRIRGIIGMVGTPSVTPVRPKFYFYDGVNAVEIGVATMAAVSVDNTVDVDWTPNGVRSASGQGLYVFSPESGYTFYTEIQTLYIAGQ